MKRISLVVAMVFLWSANVMAGQDFSEYCQKQFKANGVCPQDICESTALASSPEQHVCQPKRCDKISAEKCPLDFCAVMTNCRGQQICQFQMFDPPECGNVSYAGQDVKCCDGLVRRCGIAFLDDTCDMYGDNSEYSLPICIPCGDGVCNNFENICNCPEDCWPDGDRKYTGQRYDKEKIANPSQ